MMTIFGGIGVCLFLFGLLLLMIGAFLLHARESASKEERGTAELLGTETGLYLVPIVSVFYFSYRLIKLVLGEEIQQKYSVERTVVFFGAGMIIVGLALFGVSFLFS